MFRVVQWSSRRARREAWRWLSADLDVSASVYGTEMLRDFPWQERDDMLFTRLREEAEAVAEDALLGDIVKATILPASNLTEAVTSIVARKLSRDIADTRMQQPSIDAVMREALFGDERVGADIIAIMSRDPAAVSYLQVCLFLKGFHSVQAQRCARQLFLSGNRSDVHESFALQDRVNEIFHVDVHPGADLGGGLLMDHATGVVIGETAVVGRDCTILHGVSLGGTGKARTHRHPKIGNRVTIGAGATVVGAVSIADDVTIGSQAVVSISVPSGLTVVGQNMLLNPKGTSSRINAIKQRPRTWYYEVNSEA